MKESITIEQLNMYLPYGLKFERNVRVDDEDQERIKTMRGIYQDTNVWLVDLWESKFNVEYCMPIVHRLDALTKPIVVDKIYAKGSKVTIWQDAYQNFGGGYSSIESFTADQWDSWRWNPELNLSLPKLKFLWERHVWTGEQSYFDKGLLIDKATI